jgi:hypothetical protein
MPFPLSTYYPINKCPHPKYVCLPNSKYASLPNSCLVVLMIDFNPVVGERLTESSRLSDGNHHGERTSIYGIRTG